jgi:hypothetical protein
VPPYSSAFGRRVSAQTDSHNRCEARLARDEAQSIPEILHERVDKCVWPRVERLFCYAGGVAKLAPGLRTSNLRWHAGLDHMTLDHGEMELHLFIGSLVESTAGKHCSKPDPYVNQKLLEHHGARGSITRFTACTIRRQFDTSTVICLRPRGVRL